MNGWMLAAPISPPAMQKRSTHELGGAMFSLTIQLGRRKSILRNRRTVFECRLAAVSRLSGLSPLPLLNVLLPSLFVPATQFYMFPYRRRGGEETAGSTANGAAGSSGKKGKREEVAKGTDATLVVGWMAFPSHIFFLPSFHILLNIAHRLPRWPAKIIPLPLPFSLLPVGLSSPLPPSLYSPPPPLPISILVHWCVVRRSRGWSGGISSLTSSLPFFSFLFAAVWPLPLAFSSFHIMWPYSRKSHFVSFSFHLNITFQSGIRIAKFGNRYPTGCDGLTLNRTRESKPRTFLNPYRKYEKTSGKPNPETRRPETHVNLTSQIRYTQNILS